MTPQDVPGTPASPQPDGPPPQHGTAPQHGTGPRNGTGPAVESDAADNDAFWGAGDGGERRRKKRWPRVLIAIGVFVALVVAGLGGLVWQRQSAWNGNVDRLPGVMPEAENRPGPNVAGTENWLLVGSDRRSETQTTGQGSDGWKPGEQRTDTIMLMHLPADRSKAYMISFPRDSWVDVPGYGKQKINAAFSYGGPKLLIQTIEGLTGVRIDHYGAIDFAGFESMVDALGGVTVNIKKSVYDPARKVNWQAGKQELDGEEALLFVRQRYNLPNGDFDRMKRQQALLRALAKKAADNGTLTNPLKLDRFVSALTKSISVDDGMSGGDLRSFAVGLRHLRVSDVTFLTAPHKGTGMVQKQSVVFLDPPKAKALFDAVKSAGMPAYVQRYGGGSDLGTVS
ncbi:LCP family protein [Actinomadura sp. WMMB 499]|uniref:LCP family protein n=1 Tax=Actinomadura sp. WMMB 499 TaxID=1219491 RepID=UPI001247844D|nr:LCP family protein [Actinomadura sp. WMMB 499]QFG23756.1 LytR family transcriptional regulator [Actinomadura sp. WMMB 499]